MARFASIRVAPKPEIFPLSIHSSKRYLINALGNPFLPVVESAWSSVCMLTSDQVHHYLSDRAWKGVNGVQIMGPVKAQTNNTPAYANVYGETPFTSNTDWSTYNNAFWTRYQNFISAAKQLGIVVFLFLGYLGYLGDGTEGWAPQINDAANTAAKLNTFGQGMANLLSGYKNIILVLGGDYGNAAAVEKQFNIVRGWREVDPTVLISAHGGRTSEAYSVLSAQLTEIGAYLLNGVYTNDYEEYSMLATAYGRAGPIPVIDLDHQYEGYAGHTATYTSLGQHVSMCSGAKGIMFGNVPVCEFGAGFWGTAIGAPSTLSSNLNTDGVLRTQYAADLYTAYNWHLLEPKTDTSLVTTALGTGSGRVAPSLASDGSFAMIWTPQVNITVNMAALTPSSVRARWFNESNAVFTTASGSPFANTGTQAFTAPAYNAVLVLDATP